VSLWDMGVTITADLMSSSQCIKSAATALLLLLLVSHMTSNRSLSSRVNTSLPVKIHSISRPTARRVIGMVRRNFRHLDIDNFRLIYKTYIRPHLEFCIRVWSPHFVKDIEVLKRVQKAATILVNVNVDLYSASSQKAPLMRSMCRVLIKKTRLQCTTKTVNLHVRLTQIVLEQVPCRWSSDSEGATAVRIELKPWN